jgi:hypothetical protein
MWEAIPVILGAALGLVAVRWERWLLVRLGCGALAIGIVVSLAAGELAENPAFALVDGGVALLAAVVARALVLAVARRQSRA